jgi:hypothetical protein
VKHENTHKQHKQVTYYLSMRPKQWHQSSAAVFTVCKRRRNKQQIR